MNHYPHHIGDYLRSTAHLNFVEDAAYSRLLRKYYDDEAALSDDVPALCRLMRAHTRAEKAAVETVLHEFFTLEGDGRWHNSRADREIELYERQRGNGAKGGRPKNGTQPEPKHNPTNNPTNNPNVTQHITQTEPKPNPNRTQTEPNA
jgi:uncharacterized protein YdaU (DUF1376 family)